jgi:hypothetical protein
MSAHFPEMGWSRVASMEITGSASRAGVTKKSARSCSCAPGLNGRPTAIAINFDLLYAFVIVRLDRRDLVWINVTANPTAEWVARQITEAFPWDEAPHYLIRDRDRIYRSVVTRRLRAMGIRDRPTAPASSWQNGFAERLIGSIRRGRFTIWRSIKTAALHVCSTSCDDNSQETCCLVIR